MARRSPSRQELGSTIQKIDNNATSGVRARSEAAHKAKRSNRTTYETAQRETTQFVIDVFAETWVSKLRDSNSLCTEVSPKDIFSHLQVGCTGRHALDLLALHNEMQRYHLEVEGIPKYSNMLEEVALYLIMKRQEVEGVPTCAPHLGM